MYMGGSIVLHSLCQYLCELGYDARIFYINKFEYMLNNRFKYWFSWFAFSLKGMIKKLLISIFGDSYFDVSIDMVFKCKTKKLPFVNNDTIVIYPETVFGNPLHAKKVVRWLLYYNKIYRRNGENTIGYDKNDLFFAYRDIFNDSHLNPEKRLLHVCFFDLDLYKRTNYGERSGKCYILRKGAGRPDIPKNFDGIVIDDLSEKEKVEVFNKCEYCISYDTQTSYSQIAAMCGCVSIVVPEEGKSREDYRSNGDNDYGEAFGFSKEEISYAQKTAPYIIERYKSIIEKSRKNALNFINDVNKYFHEDK